MRIAFYAPLKSPNHPVPSGDRQMARLLIAALQMAGHTVELASELRSYRATPDEAAENAIADAAVRETAALLEKWRSEAAPDLWFTYHLYYKTPDFIGPVVATTLGIPYVTAEASYSRRRDEEGWAGSQSLVAAAVRQAMVNLCFTERDRKGLAAAIPEGRYARLAPFIDTTAFDTPPADRMPTRLITVAMMRRGDKFESYRLLAKSLELIRERDWTLTVIGDGPAMSEIQALFAAINPARISWCGERSTETVAAELRTAGIYVWPGCGEAYGIAYLEAQAAGLPVVAQATAGVPEVVQNGETGLLTPDGDITAFADAMARMLSDDRKRTRMGDAARIFVRHERSLPTASKNLDTILRNYLGQHHVR